MTVNSRTPRCKQPLVTIWTKHQRRICNIASKHQMVYSFTSPEYLISVSSLMHSFSYSALNFSQQNSLVIIADQSAISKKLYNHTNKTRNLIFNEQLGNQSERKDQNRYRVNRTRDGVGKDGRSDPFPHSRSSSTHCRQQMGWQNIVYKIVFNDNRNEVILLNTDGKERGS